VIPRAAPERIRFNGTIVRAYERTFGIRRIARILGRAVPRVPAFEAANRAESIWPTDGDLANPRVCTRMVDTMW
jgi:hypothetical protein